MHFLFLSSILGPTIGGTEALVARMSKWLLNREHEVTLLATNVCGFRELLPQGLKIVEANDQLFDLSFYHKCKTLWPTLGIARPDVIKSFDLTASWIATVLASRMEPVPKVVFGNYMPYIIPRSSNPLKQRTRRLLLCNLMRSYTDESILCMTKEHITEFQNCYGRHRRLGFWPLPIEDPAANGPGRMPQWGRIVSIGRLDPMKEYNLYMIDVVARLRKKGLPVTWTVYGDGSLSAAMKDRIQALGLDVAIEMKGKIANAKVAAALREAYVFVGMGTAMVEAALCGVPGVVALAYEPTDITYGPLYRFTFGNVGERMNTAPTTTIEAEIERVLSLSPQEYEKETQTTRDYAKGYEMDVTMKAFLGIVKRAAPPRSSLALFYWYYLDSLINRLLQKAPPGASPDFFAHKRAIVTAK